MTLACGDPASKDAGSRTLIVYHVASATRGTLPLHLRFVAYTRRCVEHVYFTWPDQRCHYDCRACGACCKGHGIGLDVAGGQLVQLLARRPALTAFLRRRGDAITAFNPRDRCWFLADDGLCRIEVEDGRLAKPASCRLFPFNRIFRLGPYTIVDYNSAVCPLRVGDHGTSHADIADEIATITDPAIIATPLAALDPAVEGRSFVDTERAIATALWAAPGDLPTAWSAQADAPALAHERAIASDAFTTLLHTPWQPPSLATLTAATWLTPSLRFNELYGPRQYAPRYAMAPILARMWLAWLGFAALGEQLAGRSLGLQELSTLWTEQAPLLHVVARWTDTPVLKPGPIDLPGIDPHNLVRSLAQAFVHNRKPKQPLGTLIAALPGDPTARVTALKAAESILRAGFAGR